MISITNVDFQKQTIDKIDLGGNVEKIQVSFTDSTFTIQVIKDEEPVMEEPVMEEVVVEPVEEEPVMELVEPVEEVIEEVEEVMEEVVEPIEEIVEPIEEQPVMEESPLSLGKLKEIMKEHIPKANTLDSYLRTIKQVYDHFKITDMTELFRTKEQDIINFIESQYTNNSTIKSKLCSIYKPYKILNIEGELLKKKD